MTGARIRVIADDGWVALDERLTSADLRSGHFRGQLVERVGWAVADAEARDPGHERAGDPSRAGARTLPADGPGPVPAEPVGAAA